MMECKWGKLLRKKKPKWVWSKNFKQCQFVSSLPSFPSISFLYSIVQRIEIIKIQHLFPLTVEIFNGLYVQKCWNMAQTLSSIFLLFPTISTVKKSCTKIMNNLHVSIAMWLIWFSLTSTLAHYFFLLSEYTRMINFPISKKKKKNTHNYVEMIHRSKLKKNKLSRIQILDFTLHNITNVQCIQNTLNHE